MPFIPRGCRFNPAGYIDCSKAPGNGSGPGMAGGNGKSGCCGGGSSGHTHDPMTGKDVPNKLGGSGNTMTGNNKSGCCGGSKSAAMNQKQASNNNNNNMQTGSPPGPRHLTRLSMAASSTGAKQGTVGTPGTQTELKQQTAALQPQGSTSAGTASKTQTGPSTLQSQSAGASKMQSPRVKNYKLVSRPKQTSTSPRTQRVASSHRQSHVKQKQVNRQTPRLQQQVRNQQHVQANRASRCSFGQGKKVCH
jgi:hypothetical protein